MPAEHLFLVPRRPTPSDAASAANRQTSVAHSFAPRTFSIFQVARRGSRAASRPHRYNGVRTCPCGGKFPNLPIVVSRHRQVGKLAATSPTRMDGNAIVYCEGHFASTGGKTAHGLVRFTRRYRVVAV